MAGEYSIQFHDKTGKEPMREKRFNDFVSLKQFIAENKTAEWENSVQVHVPSRASDDERLEIRQMGFQSN